VQIGATGEDSINEEFNDLYSSANIVWGRWN